MQGSTTITRQQTTLADLILGGPGAAEFLAWASRVHITVERIDEPIPLPEVSESSFGEFDAASRRGA